MLAEIGEHPVALRELRRRALEEWRLPRSLFRGVSSALVVGSGSSFNVALMARFYLETVAGLPARADHASEAFRHRVPGRPIAIGLSHSGGSADVRAALKRARRQGARTLALTNLPGSPLVQGADAAVVTGAGVESAIPSTKGFTTLAAASFLLASYLAGSMTSGARAIARGATVLERVVDAPSRGGLGERVAASRAVVCLGEGILYPVARDGALKLLEVTQLPALAYPPEEFRHGPVALLEPGVAVISLGRVSPAVAAAIDGSGATLVRLPPIDGVSRTVRPLVRAVQLQLLAHDAGVSLGRDVDRPRGLTKVIR